MCQPRILQTQPQADDGLFQIQKDEVLKTTRRNGLPGMRQTSVCFPKIAFVVACKMIRSNFTPGEVKGRVFPRYLQTGQGLSPGARCAGYTLPGKRKEETEAGDKARANNGRTLSKVGAPSRGRCPAKLNESTRPRHAQSLDGNGSPRQRVPPACDK